MSVLDLKEKIDGIDIYIVDQILKNRYCPGEKILDAGCGSGRNLKWFYNSGFEVYGIDLINDDITYCKSNYTKQEQHFEKASLEELPFEDDSFNHVICNAVLHFATDVMQFSKMFKELIRVLKPEGSLFIRMASEFGIKQKLQAIGNGNYNLPDGSTRFLLTEELLQEIKNISNLDLLEDVKTTIVENKRSMTTLVFQKNKDTSNRII